MPNQFCPFSFLIPAKTQFHRHKPINIHKPPARRMAPHNRPIPSTSGSAKTPGLTDLKKLTYCSRRNSQRGSIGFLAISGGAVVKPAQGLVGMGK